MDLLMVRKPKRRIGRGINMKHISIEGMDGVGKTTVCQLLAKKLGYQFVEKPLHYLLDKPGKVDEYRKLAKKVNADDDRTFTAWFYGLNNIYLYDKFKGKNIVTDRHIVSNYCWSGTKDNGDIYNLILKKIGKPTLTVILYATPKAILQRLKGRNLKDEDISKIKKSEEAYKRMISFCKNKKLPYVVVDSTDKTPEEVVKYIIKYIHA